MMQTDLRELHAADWEMEKRHQGTQVKNVTNGLQGGPEAEGLAPGKGHTTRCLLSLLQAWGISGLKLVAKIWLQPQKGTFMIQLPNLQIGFPKGFQNSLRPQNFCFCSSRRALGASFSLMACRFPSTPEQVLAEKLAQFGLSKGSRES